MVAAKKKSSRVENEKTEFNENPPEMDGVKDMTSLIHLEEPNVLHNLKCRFDMKTVYTEIGSILLSMNPYEWIDSLYGIKVINKYSKCENVELNDPHCYKISTRAIDAIKSTGKSQSILICGESGSGKTESSKACIDLLVMSRKNKKHEGLAEQIIAINPLLEALGNAKTTRNNNSSRFGKFTKILLTEFTRSNPEDSLETAGCRIESYLLEKSRVVSHEPVERNFHIFYFIFHSSNKKLCLTKPTDYKYIAKTAEHVKHVEIADASDKKRYVKMKESIKLLGMSEDLSNNLEELVAAILHLGNIEIEHDEKGFCKIVESKNSSFAIKKASELIGVEENKLKKRLTTRKIKVGFEIIESPLSLDEALVNRNAISKSLYSIIFNWVFKEVNESFLIEKKNEKLLNIGILDIFGFEAFPRNSFEQFCINYANESLQQLFSESLMIAEQNEYIKEGVFWNPLEFPENTEIVELFSDSKNGIFYLLEAACNMPKGTANIFVSNVMMNHRKNKKIKNVKMNKNLKDTLIGKERFNGFLVHHFAEDVIYNCNEFLEKNKDLVSDETNELFRNSTTAILKKVFSTKTRKNQRGVRKNIGKKFLDSLTKLISGFEETDQHFIRCINPNTKKSNKIWEVPHVTDQLRSSGIIPVLKVVKTGYPNRISYEDLEINYRKLVSHPIVDGLSRNKFWEAILAGFAFQKKKYEFGLTKIFFKPNVPFIQELKKQNGPLTETQVKRIKYYFVTQRFRKLKGLAVSFIRIRNLLLDKRLRGALLGVFALSIAFAKPLSKIKLKIKAEREEALRIERERKMREEKLERERKEKEARLKRERLEKERIEKEKNAEMERIADIKRREKEKMIREEEKKRLEKERIELEKQKKEEEEKRAEEERIRRIEEEKRAAEEAERRIVEAMVAVKLIFVKKYAEKVKNLNDKIKTELAYYFNTPESRYEIVTMNNQEEEDYIVDVRIKELTFDEEHKKFEKNKLEKHREELKSKENWPKSTLNELVDISRKKSFKNSLMEINEYKLNETTSRNNSFNEKSSKEDIKTEEIDNSKESKGRDNGINIIRKLSLSYPTRLNLSKKIKDADFSTESSDKVLYHVMKKIGRNCEIKVYHKPEVKLIKTKTKKKKNVMEHIIYSLSISSDGLTYKMMLNPLLSDVYFFQKLLDGQYPEIKIYFRDEKKIVFDPPTEETDIRVVVYTLEPINKNSAGVYNLETKQIVGNLANEALQYCKDGEISFDYKVGIVIDGNTVNWSILRVLPIIPKKIAKQLVFKSTDGYKKWMVQSLSEEILCFNRISFKILKELRNQIYVQTGKTKKLIEIIKDPNCCVGKKSVSIKIFWMLQKFEFLHNATKQSILDSLLSQIEVEGLSHCDIETRKVFVRNSEGNFDLKHEAFIDHNVRSIIKTLVFIAFYTRRSNWIKQLDIENYSKIVKILKNEIEIGELRSDLTINTTLFIMTSLKRVDKEFGEKIIDLLKENEIGNILRILMVAPSSANFSEPFAIKVAILVEEIVRRMKKEEALKLLLPLEKVLMEYLEVYKHAEGSERCSELIEFSESNLQRIRAFGKKKNSQKGFFKRLFR